MSGALVSALRSKNWECLFGAVITAVELLKIDAFFYIAVSSAQEILSGCKQFPVASAIFQAITLNVIPALRQNLVRYRRVRKFV